ncbi:hypothetical protein HK405_014371 [Cladochytrium tenue]|nr:hypothetical protein HK405_014371 [Cladochytrium tenue]
MTDEASWVGRLVVPGAAHWFDSVAGPRTLYSNWAAGRALEAVYAAAVRETAAAGR